LLSSVDGAATLVPEVGAPPEARTITPDSSVVTVSDDDADAPDSVMRPPDSSPVECSEEVVDDSSDVEVDAVGFDSDAVELEEADDEESSAHATPGVVATAPLTPSATARAPTRPMYLAYAVGVVGLEFAERELSEFAIRRVAAGPSRLLGRGDHAVATSGSAGECSPAACVQCGLEGFASFMTTPWVQARSPPTSAFAVNYRIKRHVK
jgi:hypothetical protein